MSASPCGCVNLHRNLHEEEERELGRGAQPSCARGSAPAAAALDATAGKRGVTTVEVGSPTRLADGRPLRASGTSSSFRAMPRSRPSPHLHRPAPPRPCRYSRCPLSVLGRRHEQEGAQRADICTKFITPGRRAGGLGRATQIREEVSFTKGRIIVRGKLVTRGKAKRADYVLYYKPNIPIAIIEAKDNNHAVGDGMQQALDYAETLDIPFVFSSNGDGFVFHDRTGTAPEAEADLPLEGFPSPARLWASYRDWKGLTPEAEADRPAGLLRRRQRQGAALLPAQRHQRGHRGDRQGPGPRPAGHGDRHRQDLHRVPDHLAALEGRAEEAHALPRRPQRPHRPDDGQRLPAIRPGHGEAQHRRQDHRARGRHASEITSALDQKRRIDTAYEIYLGLYQAITGPEERQKLFREFSPGFFDLIVIDECHRGSAADDSAWREILDYFSAATQIGMTATPKETKYVSNIHYFGEPVYTYSLKQGIQDGFLAPYKVIKVHIDVDVEGYRPEKGKTDRDGDEIEDRIYNQKDFDRTLVIDDRTKLVAQRVTEFLKESGDRFQKTIVFCVDQEHAARMRQALVNENADLCAENRRYVMRITGERQGRAGTNSATSSTRKSTYPVLVTTSRLLSTGVDAQTCRLIVLDRAVGSMTEFKQILGRGTRVHEDTKKFYFTLMDFRGATSHFADPDFDGEPVQIYEPDDDDPDHAARRGAAAGRRRMPIPPDAGRRRNHRRWRPPDITITTGADDRRKMYVNGVPVTIIAERVKYLDADGKLVTESLRDYSKKALRSTSPPSMTSCAAGRAPTASRRSSTSWKTKGCGSNRSPTRSARTSIPSTSSATSPTAGRR